MNLQQIVLDTVQHIAGRARQFDFPRKSLMRFAIGQLKIRVILAFIAIICPAATRPAQATDEPAAKVPQNAPTNVNRDNLAARLHEQREFRVIVGLETEQERSQSVDATPDQAKEQAVYARQLRVLARLAEHNVRDVTRLRHHHFMAMTVDAAALSALLADPEVSSVTEDRPAYPASPEPPVRRPGFVD